MFPLFPGNNLHVISGFLQEKSEGNRNMHDVVIEHLSFSYSEGGRLILEDINLEVSAGEFVCLLGQSGCGKSTLLRLLAGLEKPTSGQIKIGDKVLKGADLERSVVFQDYGLFPWMTAGENILLALEEKFPAKKKKELKQIALQAICSVGLDEEVFHKYPKELSGGMKQRCAIARSFSVDPTILLMDEPFGALDALTRAKLQDMVLELWAKEAQKKTVFFVTHDVDEALLLANRICVLGQTPSQIIYEQKIPEEKRHTRETLYEDPEAMRMRNELIKQFHQDIVGRCN